MSSIPHNRSSFSTQTNFILKFEVAFSPHYEFVLYYDDVMMNFTCQQKSN